MELLGYPPNLPYAPTAVIGTQVIPHLGLAMRGEVVLIFPRATPFAIAQRMARHFNGTVYVVKVRVTHEITAENYYYDHRPLYSS